MADAPVPPMHDTAPGSDIMGMATEKMGSGDKSPGSDDGLEELQKFLDDRKQKSQPAPAPQPNPGNPARPL